MTVASHSMYRELQAEISNAIAGAQTMAAVFRPTLEYICNATNWSVGHALICTRDNVLESTGIWFLANDVLTENLNCFRLITESHQFPAKKGIPGSVLEDGQPVWLTSVQEYKGFLRLPAARIAQLASGFAVPLRFGSSVIGVLEFYSRTPQSRDDALLDMMLQLEAELGALVGQRLVHDPLLANPQWSRKIIEDAGKAFIGMDDSGRITDWNKTAVDLLGWSKKEALGRCVSDLIIPPRYQHAHEDGLRRYLHDKQSRVLGKKTELSAVDWSGREFPIQITRWALADSQRMYFYAFIDDLTQQKEQEAYLQAQLARERALEQYVLHDTLTGLANRGLLLDRLERLQAHRSETWRSFAVLFVDFDGFKKINDRLGHIIGDQALAAFANILTGIARQTDTVARFAGDEFALICSSADTYDDAIAVAQRILEAIAAPIRIDDHKIALSASIGIVLASKGDAATQLVNAADTAMYRAKRLGGTRYEVFDKAMRLETTPLWRLEAELKRAIETDQLRLYFQPIINAANNQVSGAEALIRWQHPHKGLLTPKDFLPLDEDTGLIIAISHWVIRQACQCAQRWQAHSAELAPRYISINLSAKELEHANIVTTIRNALSETVFDRTRIRIGMEITENTIMRDPEGIAKKIQELKELGIWFALDDFGTGYSSLSHLKDIPLNCIKIDRSFVHNIEHSRAEYSITNAVVTLAHSLGLIVVGEGVETEKQASILSKIGVDFLQGYLYGRAQPAEGFERALWNNAV